MPAPTLSELKTYLGITTSNDDALLTTCIASGTSQAERDTGRTFSYSSNNVRDYSTDGQAVVQITDIPKTDSSRIVTLNGVALTETQGYWLLPDRRNPDISTTIQLAAFDTNRADWFKADPQWWDKNLDTFWRRYGSIPLDLRIASYVGHPTWTSDVFEQVRFLAAWFYWRAKSGASGVIQTPTGEEIDLSTEPSSSPVFKANWRIRTAVANV
jgi:gp6-like head-tail connector protein